MKILVKGAGDLATGIAAELYEAGHRILMTEIPQPLAVRRKVAFSSAVYEGEITVEGITAVLVEDLEEAYHQIKENKIPVIIDPEAKIRQHFCPDIMVDAIMAKKNIGTTIEDASLVIAIGPGFAAGKDCHYVIETQRGSTLGAVIKEGSAIPNTGVPGMVAGYTIERLLKAAADGIMEPVASIGDVVEQGQIVARTGGEPVRAGLTGLIRGMLPPGIQVKKGMKIGDIDARLDPDLCITISDKARLLGKSICSVVKEKENREKR